MMAINRYRLRHLARLDNTAAQQTLELLQRTDKLLGVILLGNNLINAASATLATLIAIRLLGTSKWVLGIATLSVTFAILVISEITPKVIGAAYPEEIALPASFILRPLLTITYPIVWFVNLFVQSLLKLMHLNPNGKGDKHVPDSSELRSMVLESGMRLVPQHRQALLNLLDLESMTVNDIMTPRHLIEALDIHATDADITRQLTSSHHTRLPVFRDHLNEIAGFVHLRDLIREIHHRDITPDIVLSHLHQASFILSGTKLFTQLRQFQLTRQNIGLVVDEYGELQGLLSLGDILEEMVGELDTNLTANEATQLTERDGSWLVDGSRHVRQINRRLGLLLPEDGPKTINGLILEYLGHIPDLGTTVKIANYPIEIIQVQERLIKTARIFPRLPS